MQELKDLISNKKVLFITTKNIDYLRNTQEIRIIKESAESIDIIYSDTKNYIFRILNVWKQITKKRIDNNDVVFVGFEPQFVIPFMSGKFQNKFLIVDFFISVYDTLICDRKKFKDGGLVSKFSRWMDEKTIRVANHIITDTKAHAAFFSEEFKGEGKDFETLYLEADRSIYFPREQSKEENLKDKTVVLYFGSILPLQGVDVVLDTVRLLENNNDIFFDIIGPIPKGYEKAEGGNVRYTDWLSQEELAARIANADLCLAGHFSSTIDKAWRTIPGKAYIYEMMEKPMILGDGRANHELFESDEKHMFTKRGSSEALAETITEFVKRNRKRKKNV